MKISVVTMTYGRVERLQEAIESFLRQTHKDSELIVLNTCPQQTLQGDFPNVKIINLKERPANLGSARNIAVEQADDGIICLLDDDDLALPHYLSTYAKAFSANPAAEWIWVNQQFYLESGKIRKIAMGMCNTFSFLKSAWSKVGGYDAINVGEDRAFIGKITQQFKGAKVEVKAAEIAYLYCWGNGVYHLSGLGDDKKQRFNSWDRSRMDLEHKIRRGAVKTGNVDLKPAWKQDYSTLASEFIGKSVAQPAGDRAVCLIELGRFGDIINILPVARMIAERWGKPAFMVNREFASILDGVSYVVPHIFEPEYGNIEQAISLAKKHYPVVINAQIWGTTFHQERKSRAFNMESWRMAGFEKDFSNPSLFPVFDLRDLKLEESIFKKLSVGKPVLLLKLYEGHSSPFPKTSAKELEAIIRRNFENEYQIIELTSITAPHLYDLIGLMDRARLLVSIDTSMLHLAGASGIPVISLTTEGWTGTEPRFNRFSNFHYHNVIQNPGVVVAAIESALKTAVHRPMAEPAAINPPVRKLFHAVERHDDERGNRRKVEAWKSWDALYTKGVVPCHYWTYARNARAIGDKRALPYLKDVLQFAMNQAGGDDVIFFTNDDLYLHPGLYSVLLAHVSIYEACCSQRCDFRPGQIPQLSETPEIISKASKLHMGRDLFAFTKNWLTQHWDEIGDFILGASDWDLALANMIRLHHGIKSNRVNLEQVIHPAEIQKGYVIHEEHASEWSRPNVCNTAPSQIHNRKLHKNWASKYMPDLAFLEGNVI